jgi:Na+/H+ antiporter NhaC
MSDKEFFIIQLIIITILVCLLGGFLFHFFNLLPTKAETTGAISSGVIEYRYGSN